MQKHFGRDGPIFVWQAATEVMNPSVDRDYVAEQTRTIRSQRPLNWRALASEAFAFM